MNFQLVLISTTGRIGAGVYGSSNGYLSVNNASNPLSEADWRDKDVRITIIKSGNNTMYLWVNGVVEAIRIMELSQEQLVRDSQCM